VRWYLRYSLPYRDVEELLAERDILVDHVTICRCPGLQARVFSARTTAAGHALAQNLRRGHYELVTDHTPHDRLPAVFAELARCL
jgi:hypothetical protein